MCEWDSIACYTHFHNAYLLVFGFFGSESFLYCFWISLWNNYSPTTPSQSRTYLALSAVSCYFGRIPFPIKQKRAIERPFSPIIIFCQSFHFFFQFVFTSAAKILLHNSVYSSYEISSPFNVYFIPASALFGSNSSPKFISAVRLSAPSNFSIW